MAATVYGEGKIPARLVKHSNQVGVRTLAIDFAGDGCFVPSGTMVNGVSPRTVATAERMVKAYNAYPDMIEFIRKTAEDFGPFAVGATAKALLKKFGEAS